MARQFPSPFNKGFCAFLAALLVPCWLLLLPAATSGAMEQDPDQAARSAGQLSTEVEALLQAGANALQEGDARQAASAYSDALLLGADPDLAMTGLAEAYLKQGKHREVISALPLPVASSPQEAEVLGYHALAYLQLGKPDRALQAMESALASYPGAVMPRVAQSRMLLSAGRHGEALQLARQLTDQHQDTARGWQVLGLAAQVTGNHNIAIEAYGNAVELDPHQMSSRINRIRLLLGEGRDSEADSDLAFTAQHYPEEPSAAFLRGLARERAGDTGGAQLEFRHAAETFAELPLRWVAGNPQTTVSAATAHLRLGDNDRARHYLEASHALNTSNRHITLMLAALLLEQDEPDRALQLVDQLLLSKPRDPDLLNIRAYCLQLLGQPTVADGAPL